jgi:hypothetical protein
MPAGKAEAGSQSEDPQKPELAGDMTVSIE